MEEVQVQNDEKVDKAPVIDDFPGKPRYSQQKYIPVAEDQRLVRCVMKLAAPACPLLEFRESYSLSTQIAAIAEAIKRRHGGSIKDISICVGSYSPDKFEQPYKTLAECGVTADRDVVIYYDFIPISGPLLGH